MMWVISQVLKEEDGWWYMILIAIDYFNEVWLPLNLSCLAYFSDKQIAPALNCWISFRQIIIRSLINQILLK